MYLCCFAIIGEDTVILKIIPRQISDFLGRRARRALDDGSILVGLAQGELARGEKIVQRDPWRR